MKEKILSLYLQKYPLSDISKLLDISLEEVDLLLKENYIIDSKYRIRDKTIAFRNGVLYFLEQKCSATNAAKYWGVTPTSFCKYLKQLGIPAVNHQNETKFNENIFDNIDTEEKAYWLGFIFADGSISKKETILKQRYQFELSLTSSDTEHLDKFNKFMGHIKNNVKQGTVKLNGKTFKRCRWIINNKHLWQQLNNLGCVPQKSLILQFPNIPETLKRHFIRGYFDGDGSLGIYETKYNPKIQCSLLGTKDMLDNILFLSNINASLKQDKRHSEFTYEFKLVSAKAISFLNYIYKDSTIYLNRKYEKYLDSCRFWEKSQKLLQSNIGEDCDVNTEITIESNTSIAS